MQMQIFDSADPFDSVCGSFGGGGRFAEEIPAGQERAEEGEIMIILHRIPPICDSILRRSALRSERNHLNSK